VDTSDNILATLITSYNIPPFAARERLFSFLAYHCTAYLSWRVAQCNVNHRRTSQLNELQRRQIEYRARMAGRCPQGIQRQQVRILRIVRHVCGSESVSIRYSKTVPRHAGCYSQATARHDRRPLQPRRVAHDWPMPMFAGEHHAQSRDFCQGSRYRLGHRCTG
jgi:hypothetical protein